MSTQFENLKIAINAPRQLIWEVATDFSNYYRWNSIVPDAHGCLETGNQLSTSLKLNGRTRRSTCRVNEVCPHYHFVLSRTMVFKKMLYMEHAFHIHSIGGHLDQFMFVQTLQVSGLLRGWMMQKLTQTWASFRQMNLDLKDYVLCLQLLRAPNNYFKLDAR